MIITDTAGGGIGGVIKDANINNPEAIDPCSWKGLPSADDFYTINNISNVNEGATGVWGMGN